VACGWPRPRDNGGVPDTPPFSASPRQNLKGDSFRAEYSHLRAAILERRRLAQLQKALGVKFKNSSLLEQALVHRSYLNEARAQGLESNERLEFLGDAVLGLVISQELCASFPTLDEGDLTRLKTSLIRWETLARAADRLALGEHLLLGRGEESTGGRQRPSNLARVLEAVLGAAFLDRGLNKTRDLVLRCLAPDIAQIETGQIALDSKSRLQQLAQSYWHETPVYRTVSADGPDHAKVFTVEVQVAGRSLGCGSGRSKKEAESEAAGQAVETILASEPALPQASSPCI
jgi:ribonuclease-3